MKKTRRMEALSIKDLFESADEVTITIDLDDLSELEELLDLADMADLGELLDLLRGSDLAQSLSELEKALFGTTSEEYVKQAIEREKETQARHRRQREARVRYAERIRKQELERAKKRAEERKDALRVLRGKIERLHALQSYMAGKHFFRKTRTEKTKYYKEQIALIDKINILSIEADHKGYNFTYNELQG